MSNQNSSATTVNEPSYKLDDLIMAHLRRLTIESFAYQSSEKYIPAIHRALETLPVIELLPQTHAMSLPSLYVIPKKIGGVSPLTCMHISIVSQSIKIKMLGNEKRDFDKELLVETFSSAELYRSIDGLIGSLGKQITDISNRNISQAESYGII